MTGSVFCKWNTPEQLSGLAATQSTTYTLSSGEMMVNISDDFASTATSTTP